MKILDRLTMSTKLILISVAFIVPLAVAVLLLVRNTESISPLPAMKWQGTNSSARWRRSSNTFPGTPRRWRRAKMPRRSRAKSMPPSAELVKVNARLGTRLSFDQAGLVARKREHVLVANVQREWNDLKAAAAGLEPAVRAERHAHLVSDLRTMIVHVGDMSKLILDPDLDSFYLMDFTLVAGPQNHDRIAVVAADVDAILRRKAITSAERERLAVHVAMLKEADRDRATADIATAVLEDENFHGRNDTLQTKIPALADAYAQAVDALIKSVQDVIASESVTLSPKEFAATAQRARGALFTCGARASTGSMSCSRRGLLISSTNATCSSSSPHSRSAAASGWWRLFSAISRSRCGGRCVSSGRSPGAI